MKPLVGVMCAGENEVHAQILNKFYYRIGFQIEITSQLCLQKNLSREAIVSKKNCYTVIAVKRA